MKSSVKKAYICKSDIVCQNYKKNELWIVLYIYIIFIKFCRMDAVTDCDPGVMEEARWLSSRDNLKNSQEGGFDSHREKREVLFFISRTASIK